MEAISLIWDVVEPLAFLIVIILFFLDPIRGWNFFGIRPTAVIALVDTKAGKILMIRKSNNNHWSFPQGGIFNKDLNCTTIDILERELSLKSSKFALRYTLRLGWTRICNLARLKRASFSSIKLIPWTIGKGYIAFFVDCDLDSIKKHYKKGHGIQEVKIVPLFEAMERVNGIPEEDDEHNSKKQAMLIKMLHEAQAHIERSERLSKAFDKEKQRENKTMV